MWFTDGLWQPRNGYAVHSAHGAWEWKISGGKVFVLVPCNEVRTVEDTSGGHPNLHFVFSAPRADMISVKIYHFLGKQKKGPEFALDCEAVTPEITETEDGIRMRNGRMEVVIRTKGLFGFDFYWDGTFLTGSGNKGSVYVTDADYEADKRCDYNGRTGGAYNRKTYIRERLSLDVGECIYGLGERFSPIVRNGQSVDIWNRDGGTVTGTQAYKNIPFYLSGKGYGVLVNTPERVSFEVASVSTRHVEIALEGEELEYIVIGGGEPKEVLCRYTALTGRTPLPPAWSFGLWLSTSWLPDSDAQITYDTIDKMAAYQIPLSVFHFDARWMDEYKCCDFVWSERYGDVPQMLRKIHEKGVRTCVWINPYVSQESRLFAEGMEHGYFIRDKQGDVWQSDHWMSGIAVVDFTNPAAVSWYQARLGEVIDMGVDAVKTDFGERIPTEAIFFDGSDPGRMHNYYPYLYNQAIYDLLMEKNGEAVVFSRSATVGTQRFPVNWGGDNDSTYISMAETLRGCLSLCQSGFGYAAHDISGFLNTATPDLYKRWVQFGLLSSHSRLHGSNSYRVPWAFDEESVDVVRAFADDFPNLMYHAKTSLQEAAYGLLIGIALAFVIATVMDHFLWLDRALSPILVITQTIPTIAIAPVLVLWMGFGMAPKITLVVITTFFPITVGLLEGYQSIDADYMNLMRSMNATRMQIFRHVKFPAALPYFFSGLRISASYAVVGAVISEWLGGFEGLGVYMTRVRKAYAFDKMFAVIFLIVVISLLLMWLVNVLKNVTMPWAKVQRGA